MTTELEFEYGYLCKIATELESIEAAFDATADYHEKLELWEKREALQRLIASQVLAMHKKDMISVMLPVKTTEMVDLDFDTDTSDLDNFKAMVREENFVILDTETTGLHDGEICEIAIIDSGGNTIYDTRIKTVEPIPQSASRIHGITDADVANCPMWKDIQPQVREILRGKNVVIYNAVYDRKMMHRSDERARLERVDYKSEALYWCAMEAYAEYFGIWNEYHQSYRWQRLTNAANNEGVEVANAHSALGDCLMTLGVIQKAMTD